MFKPKTSPLLNPLAKTLFSLLIIFSSSQLGKHFWPQFSLVNGLRVDYLSPTLYVSDILIFLLIGWALINHGLSFPPRNIKRVIKWLLIISGLGVLLAWPSRSPLAYGYGLIKVAEWWGLFWAGKQIILKNTHKFWLFTSLLLILSLLSLSQFYLQKSLGGVAYFWGEREFTKLTPGIAQTIWQGQLLLRPYATFSHPNSLAGFLLVGWWLGWESLGKRLGKKQGKDRRGIWLIVTLLVMITLGLTWSRMAWLVIMVEICLWLGQIHLKPKLWPSLALGITILAVFFPFILGNFEAAILSPSWQESIGLRQKLFFAAWQLFGSQPLWGVGLKNFISHLVDFQLGLSRAWLQPVHSIYWLILAETGLLGFGLWLGLVLTITRWLTKSKNWWLFFAWVAILLTGMNDHYWLTLQQNQLLMVLLLIFTEQAAHPQWQKRK